MNWAWTSHHLEGLRLAAMIHDIGKIYVPGEILNRPDQLNKAEFEIIKSHTDVGYEIIKDVHFPWPVAEILLQYHEHLVDTCVHLIRDKGFILDEGNNT